jgi:hypothetical protein
MWPIDVMYSCCIGLISAAMSGPDAQPNRVNAKIFDFFMVTSGGSLRI